MEMTVGQRKLHERAVELCRVHADLEAEIMDVLSEINRTKLYKFFGKTSLFKYAVEVLRLTEPTAYAFITVARKVPDNPALADAIRQRKISVSKASRIVSALNQENASQLIEFASTHTWRETEQEVARLNPKEEGRERVKPISENLVRVELYLSTDAAALLKRAQDLFSSQSRTTRSGSEAVTQALREFVDRHDPVTKANRAQERMQSSAASARQPADSGPDRVRHKTAPARRPLTAEQRHAVFARDQGRCTFVDSNGQHCENRRWLHVHHKTEVCRGGGNEPENLTTLCSFHHDLVHQLSLPIDGQVTWLRARVRMYG